MNPKEKTLLQSKLSLLAPQERQKLYKRAAEIRKRNPAPTFRPGRSNSLDEDSGPEVIKVRQRSSCLDDLVLKILLQEEAVPPLPVYDGPRGIVLGIGTGTCQVLLDDKEIACRLTPELRQRQQTALAVGDEVIVVKSGDKATVETVLPRRTRLSRPDPGNASLERVIVANVDVVAIVVSVVAPPLHPRLIDRYLFAIQKGGARPLLCVNKVDLLEEETELKKLDPYRQVGIDIVLCSAEQGVGVEELRGHLRSQISAFVGHSGVGKSSLVNALRPELALKVGSVSEGYGRGTHTTTTSTLHRLPDDIRIIDTPGVRAFGLWQVQAQELEDAFPEFIGLTCRFRDCSHTHEPGCGVQQAVEDGQITEERYDTYVQLKSAL